MNDDESCRKATCGCLCSIREARLLGKCQVGVKKTCSMTSRVSVMSGHGPSIVIIHLVYLLSAPGLQPDILRFRSR